LGFIGTRSIISQIEPRIMKIADESGERRDRWFQNLSLWVCEIRLRFDLRYSRKFKRFCEKRGYPNLAGMEEDYIQKLQGEIVKVQECRSLQSNGNFCPKSERSP
jgi:hypothetical protein